MTTTRRFTADIGTTGLAGTLAYTVTLPGGTVVVPRATAGVVEKAGGRGIYQVDLANFDVVWAGDIDWDVAGVVLATLTFAAIDAGAGGDWTAGEKAQIRYRLGIDGSVATPTNSVHLDIPAAVSKGLASVGNVTFLGAVAGGVMEIVRGDSFEAAIGRSMDLVKQAGEKWPTDLTNWTITFTANRSPNNTATGAQGGVASVTFPGAVVVATGDEQEITLTPGTNKTSDLAIGVAGKGYEWDIVATRTVGSATQRATLRRGLMNVRMNQTPIPAPA